MKILITGCAKSGTTLLQRLFSAFYSTTVHWRETSLQDVCEFMDRPGEVHVFKRTTNTIFSNTLPQSVLEDQAGKIFRHHIRIVNITRRKDAVLESDGGYVTLQRYIDSLAQSIDNYDLINCHVMYESLLRDPDMEQLHVARSMCLSPRHKWSEYPNFVPHECMQGYEDLPTYRLRRIGEKP